MADKATLPPAPLGLTVAQAARHLGVSISTVRRWSDAGHLPSRRTPGGQRRYTRAPLGAFLAALQPRPWGAGRPRRRPRRATAPARPPRASGAPCRAPG